MLSVRRLNEIINEVVEQAASGSLSPEECLNYANRLNTCLEELEGVRTNSNVLNQFVYQFVQFLYRLVPALYRIHQQASGSMQEGFRSKYLTEDYGFTDFMNFLRNNGVAVPSSLMAGINGYNKATNWADRGFRAKKMRQKAQDGKRRMQNQKPEPQQQQPQQDPYQQQQPQQDPYQQQQPQQDPYQQQDGGYQDNDYQEDPYQQQDGGYQDNDYQQDPYQQQDGGYQDNDYQQDPYQQQDDDYPMPEPYQPEQDQDQNQQGPINEPDPLISDPINEYRTLMFQEYPKIRSEYVMHRQKLLPYSSAFNQAYMILEELYKRR